MMENDPSSSPATSKDGMDSSQLVPTSDDESNGERNGGDEEHSRLDDGSGTDSEHQDGDVDVVVRRGPQQQQGHGDDFDADSSPAVPPSESSVFRPDPPSVVDHVVLEEEEDDDLGVCDGDGTNRTTDRAGDTTVRTVAATITAPACGESDHEHGQIPAPQRVPTDAEQSQQKPSQSEQLPREVSRNAAAAVAAPEVVTEPFDTVESTREGDTGDASLAQPPSADAMRRRVDRVPSVVGRTPPQCDKMVIVPPPSLPPLLTRNGNASAAAVAAAAAAEVEQDAVSAIPSPANWSSTPRQEPPALLAGVPAEGYDHHHQQQSHNPVAFPALDHRLPGTTTGRGGPAPASFLPPPALPSSFGNGVSGTSAAAPAGVPLFPSPAMAAPPAASHGGRRKIKLRLQEDVRNEVRNHSTFLGHIRQRSFMFSSAGKNASSSNLRASLDAIEFTSVDRGHLAISWYDGTTSLELHDHLRKSLLRKLRLGSDMELADVRILDETVDPPEEIVLTPYIPHGSNFLLRYSTQKVGRKDEPSSPISLYRPPDSPSAAPSPPSSAGDLAGLNDLSRLKEKLHSLSESGRKRTRSGLRHRRARLAASASADLETRLGAVVDDEDNDAAASGRGGRTLPSVPAARREDGSPTSPVTAGAPKPTNAAAATNSRQQQQQKQQGEDDDDGGASKKSMAESDDDDDDDDDMALHSEDPIEARLREITQLLLADRERKTTTYRRQTKRQVVFVLANYFVLFLSLIAISAEIQARAPGWLSQLEKHMNQVHDCAADQEALFRCVSNGDFAGLIASVLLWLSRSVATRRIFLFGFETPKRLWTVVYESLVTAVCWGFSYLFIRRGMNPDTRNQFLRKYWKDAVYGSLAGFNAAFMKQILKNLIPQEAVEDVLRERQLKILNWLPTFA